MFLTTANAIIIPKPERFQAFWWVFPYNYQQFGKKTVVNGLQKMQINIYLHSIRTELVVEPTHLKNTI